MKAISYLLGFVSTFVLYVEAEPAGLEVHEWGTFTVVSGSDGAPLRWWLGGGPTSGDLPAFVGLNPLAMKSAPSYLRMETPVVYFYPDRAMAVEVHAEMRDGRITEWFPAPTASEMILPLRLNNAVTWKGQLLPPGDATAASRVPSVASERGAHYAHAREVPDAWHFQSLDPATKALQTEKFIFYRGTGNAMLPWQASAHQNGRVRLAPFGAKEAIGGAAFALRTTKGVTQWSRLPNQAEAETDLSIAPSGTAATELTTAMTEALVEAGLTKAEAKAMVATWSGHWFSESGTRVLAILPQSFVDSILPLAITPAPRKLVRVFVARFEVFTPECEAELVALLDRSPSSAADPEEAARLKALKFGRFATGALARAQNLATQRLHQRFAQLQAAVPLPGE